MKSSKAEPEAKGPYRNLVPGMENIISYKYYNIIDLDSISIHFKYKVYQNPIHTNLSQGRPDCYLPTSQKNVPRPWIYTAH